MSFDPEVFGKAMGDAINKAVAPLRQEIADLKEKLASVKNGIDGKDGENGVDGNDGKDGKDGKDCDMAEVKAMIDEFLKSIPIPKDGKDGENGKSLTADDVRPLIDEQVKKAVSEIPAPKDGVGLAGAMIDRDGALQVTMTNGELKNLGKVVGENGKDGISLDSFDLEYIEESHEVAVKAACGGRIKEIRYPAGGIRYGGYWRGEGKAKANEAWTLDGSLWIAKRDTSVKPAWDSPDWMLAARKGKDGERGEKGKPALPASPVKLSVE